MDEELDLSQALAYLLGARTAVGDFGQAQELAGRSIQLASRWPDSWISKALRVHAHGWFFFDPAAALDVFGGPEEAARLLGPESTSFVSHFTKVEAPHGWLARHDLAAALDRVRVVDAFAPLADAELGGSAR